VKILTIVGARPQFIKAAAVSRTLRADHVEVLLHTGQHYDEAMSERFFRELRVPAPDVELNVGSGSHAEQTGRMLAGIERAVIDHAPDRVLVYGDTNSTLAGALAAAKLHVPVAHVEAGLRSFNRRMPEEINRIVADHVSDLLLCPTTAAVENLAREGITAGVHHTGDVMHDMALRMTPHARIESTILQRLGVADGAFALATVHRAENTDDAAQLRRVIDWLKQAAADRPVVFPVHPRTRRAAEQAGLAFDGLVTCEPLGYLDVTRLLDGCATVYTDSGGLQKEAYFHRRPCVTLRNETEWVETVTHGWNRLWHEPAYQPRRDIPEYGDGHAAQRVVAALVHGR
jgi:UDP-GlcNAc3NAcA epimerase